MAAPAGKPSGLRAVRNIPPFAEGGNCSGDLLLSEPLSNRSVKRTTHANQSLTGKKSVNSRASGVPASGCQS